jgi:hypothetical protein
MGRKERNGRSRGGVRGSCQARASGILARQGWLEVAASRRVFGHLVHAACALGSRVGFSARQGGPGREARCSARSGGAWRAGLGLCVLVRSLGSGARLPGRWGRKQGEGKREKLEEREKNGGGCMGRRSGGWLAGRCQARGAAAVQGKGHG